MQPNEKRTLNSIFTTTKNLDTEKKYLYHFYSVCSEFVHKYTDTHYYNNILEITPVASTLLTTNVSENFFFKLIIHLKQIKYNTQINSWYKKKRRKN